MPLCRQTALSRRSYSKVLRSLPVMRKWIYIYIYIYIHTYTHVYIYIYIYIYIHGYRMANVSSAHLLSCALLCYPVAPFCCNPCPIREFEHRKPSSTTK